MNGINSALVMNGCASHYLSDMFAPGHQTNPRRAIARHANAFSSPIANRAKQFYSKWMHDEANQAGITFTNQRGDEWRGYGDGCNDFATNQRNRESARPPADRVPSPEKKYSAVCGEHLPI